MPAAIQAYGSVRDKKNQKKRAALKDDTFLHGNSERSESSGYLSQHSSYNSLLDHDSVGSVGSQEGRFLTDMPPSNGLHPSSKLNMSVSDNAYASIDSQLNGYNSNNGNDGSPSSSQPMNGRPSINDQSGLDGKMYNSQNSLNSNDSKKNGQKKVLHKMRSSSRSDGKKDSNLSMGGPGSPGGSPKGVMQDGIGGPGSPGRSPKGIMQDRILRSPRKSSVPLPLTSNKTDLSLNFRKDSLPTPIISPGASPEIRRRAESIITQQYIGAPDLDAHQKRHSGVFQFPDPLEVLNNTLNQQQSLQISSFKTSMDDISPDDFPPINPQLLNHVTRDNRTQSISSGHDNNQTVSPQRQRMKTFSGTTTTTTTTRRPAPSPPTKITLPNDMSSSVVTTKQRGSLQNNLPNPQASPVNRRHSIHSNDSSPLTPKRKAPSPPKNADQPFSRSSSRNSSIRKREDQTIPFEKQKSNDSSKQQIQSPTTESNATMATDVEGTGVVTPTNTPNHVSLSSSNLQPSTSQTPSNQSDDIQSQSYRSQSDSVSHSNPIEHSKTERTKTESTFQTQSGPSQTQRSNTRSIFQTQPGPNQTQRSRTGTQPEANHSSTFQSQPGQNQRKGSVSNSISQTQSEQNQTQRSRTGSISQTRRSGRSSTFKKSSVQGPSAISQPSTATANQTQRNRTGSSSDTSASTSSTRYGSFSESDKIAEMLRAKAKQRKQKSDEKRKKNANQILKVLGVDTSITEERSDLLRSIRKGIGLKNVRNQQEQIQKQSSSLPWDVAAILERRQAIEILSDTEHDEGAVHEAEWEDM